MKFEIKQITTICSPYCDLVNMLVQPKGAKDVYVTIVFDEIYTEGFKDLE